VLADDVWARARRQFEANRTGWPSHAQLPAGQPDARCPALDMRSPARWATSPKQPGNWYATPGRSRTRGAGHPAHRRQRPARGRRRTGKAQGRLQESERQWAWSQIGLQAAKKHLPEALDWYAKAGQRRRSPTKAYQWKVRAALRAQEWGVVLRTIEAMPPALAAQPEWIYWLGRAYKAGGRPRGRCPVRKDRRPGQFLRQPGRRGTWAQDRAAAGQNRNHRRRAESGARQPGHRRALAFFRLDLRTEAVREWNWALRGMDDRELLAAADLAKRNQIWDRAINTADRTKNEHDYTLRFLAPYGEQVRPAAQNQSLDDAWVYGLMRQESRFITSAKSNVGASGLMQLMPATAKWVAKKIGLRDYNHSRVNDTETNVLLGTSYMRLVMENLDNHPVLLRPPTTPAPAAPRNGAPTGRSKARSMPKPFLSAKPAITSKR
jgi:soluble lytic murein transglycosylase